jgi:RHS repeat-associated protein
VARSALRLPKFGRPTPVRFDANGNSRVDLYDGFGLQQCYDQTDALCLLIYDANTNGTVDLADMNAFAAAMNGPDAVATEPTGYPSRYENPFAWTGQRYDYNTQLYHFWARTFDPVTGKWNQRDMQGPLSPVEIYFSMPGAPPGVDAPQVAAESEYLDGLNLLLYLGGDPLNSIDRHFPFGIAQLRRRVVFRYDNSQPPAAPSSFPVLPFLRAEMVVPLRDTAASRPRFLASAQGIPKGHCSGIHLEGLVEPS